MFGRPTPTKQTCCPASSRAAATIIISDLEKVAVASVTGMDPCPRAMPCPRPMPWAARGDRWHRRTSCLCHPTALVDESCRASARTLPISVHPVIVSGGRDTVGQGVSIIGRPRSRPSRTGWAGLQAVEALGAELLHVRGAAVEVVDPFAEPGLDRVLVAGDRVPVEVEAVVAVVRALDVRGMRAPRLDDDRIDDESRDDRPVRVGPDHRLLDELLDDDDHAIGGEGRLLLAAEQAPHLGVATGRGALRVDDRHVRLQRRHGVDRLLAVGRIDRPDQRVRHRQVGLEVAAQREERQVHRPGGVARDHAEVAVLLDRQRLLGELALDPSPDGAEPPDPRVAEPREDELRGDAPGDHLVVDDVWRQTGERQVALAPGG